MDAKGWKKKIKAQCVAAETYKDAFIPTIQALAEILEQRDLAYQQYIDEGAEPCIIRISDRGAENIAKNPRLVVWMDLNSQALTYWRDLGLTPSGLKKIDDQALKTKKRSSLVEALRDIG